MIRSVLDPARQQELIDRHQELVRRLAIKISRLVNGRIELDDLVAYGQQGLIQAAQRFDPDRGVAFQTFAYYRIRGAIFDGVRQMGPIIQLSRSYVFAEHANEYMEQRAKETRPTRPTEAAQRLAGIVADLAVAYVMDQEVIEAQPDPSCPDPVEVVDQHDEIRTARKYVSRLPDKERRLIEMIYYEGNDLTRAAELLGISKGWASRLHAQALGKLRRAAARSRYRAESSPRRRRVKI